MHSFPIKEVLRIPDTRVIVLLHTSRCHAGIRKSVWKLEQRVDRKQTRRSYVHKCTRSYGSSDERRSRLWYDGDRRKKDRALRAATEPTIHPMNSDRSAVLKQCPPEAVVIHSEFSLSGHNREYVHKASRQKRHIQSQ
ncbi:hypothetical protein DACRYDRAFT_22044 [Dacryopinax primogenitus]|uniref:Uncharacterized protein n=1 Tax=Dacryopinax primogenitus (strain DJM 731) TaxID=1858805 RepID=M5FWQ0_DACPD|nr:uncharacterized protein DACRYDRAFT_22044 [Dacryopinax primogenitus]EJU02381.1 hypothetical protein DACRYDRAFT_22044 [Dacryopinax primogenitus]